MIKVVVTVAVPYVAPRRAAPCDAAPLTQQKVQQEQPSRQKREAGAAPFEMKTVRLSICLSIELSAGCQIVLVRSGEKREEPRRTLQSLPRADGAARRGAVVPVLRWPQQASTSLEHRKPIHLNVLRRDSMPRHLEIRNVEAFNQIMAVAHYV